MQIITDCFWLSAHLSNQITKKVSCFLIQSEFSHHHFMWWWYWLYWQRFVYWLIFSRNGLIANDHWWGLLVLIILLSQYLIDECMWGWLWQCWSILINLLCHNRNLLIMSMAVFLTTAVSTAPLEGKKREAMFCILFHFIISVWREDVLCVFQRKSWRRWRLRPQRRGRCPRRRRVGLVCVREASFYCEKQICVKLFMKHKLRVYTDDKIKPNWGHMNGTWPSHKPQSEQHRHRLWSFQTGLNLS